ncbi:M14 family zinc carboxypeptidase [Sphaerotilaceae bacterium SBD11-9]
MELAFARRWVVLVGVVGLAACSTPMPPSRPVPSFPALPPVQPAPGPAPAPVAPAVPAAPAVADAVAARFPDPAVSYRVPALQDSSRSGFTTQAELQSLVRGLAANAAPGAQLVNLGTSQRGVPLEALLFTQSPDPSGAGLQRSGRPTVLLLGQTHGDEPAGAEALLVVAQELARGSLRGLLDRINVLVLPRANPDGAQAGTHATANGVDIDHDQLLLGSPETQALARLLREYQPAVVVDAHEYAPIGNYAQKFGALPRHDALLQYAGTANLAPFITKAAEEWFREPLLASLKQQGLSAEWAYTTSADVADKRLSMGGTQADSIRNAGGLRNAVSLVVESRGAGIGRAHLKRRVHTQVVALTSMLESAAARGADLLKLRQYVEAEVSAQVCQGQAVVEAGLTPSEYTLQMLDPATGADKSLTVNWDSSLALRDLKVRPRPCGYWLAADLGDAVARLRLLGVRVDRVTATGVLQAEAYSDASHTASALVDAPVGSHYVPLSQPLANLAMAALEPDAPGSYFANGVILDLRKMARVTALPGMKLSPLP